MQSSTPPAPTAPCAISATKPHIGHAFTVIPYYHPNKKNAVQSRIK
jgi:hypothetical protein